MFTAIKMILVFALLGGTLWWLRRHDRGALLQARRGERPVAVLAQTRVGKSASVAVVRIGTDAYAVGVTDQAVTLLVPEPIELPEPEVEEPGDVATESPVPFGTALRGLAGRRPRVEYLDIATDGSVRAPSARRPEPTTRR